jgi:UDP-glucose 4-epimerase
MENNILVTGGLGYIGSHTIIELMKNGYTPIIVDNLCNSKIIILRQIENLVNKKLTFYDLDCRNDMSNIFNSHKIIGIIHFAAHKSVNDSVTNPLDYYDNNLNSLINLLFFCKKYSVHNFIFSSTCALYGNVEDLPVNENTILSDSESPYAYSKLVGERIIKDFYNSEKNFKSLCLRYFNPVGAHNSGLIGELPLSKPTNVLPVICESVNGKEMMVFGYDYNTRDGSCIRDYVHVSDIANAHVLGLNYIIEKNNKMYDIFNLGSESGVSVLELINTFQKENNVKVKYKLSDRRKGDVEKIYSDSQKAKKLLLWNTNNTITEMVKSAWLWHNNIKNL